MLGLFGAVRVIPYIVLSVPAGIVADRYDRRLVLLVTDLARAACMVAMTFVLVTDGPIAALIGLSILAACFSTFFYPAIGAYVPNLVEDERQLGPANSTWASLDNLGLRRRPGPRRHPRRASAATTLAFVINALTFLVIAVDPVADCRRRATSAPVDLGRARRTDDEPRAAGGPPPHARVAAAPEPLRPGPDRGAGSLSALRRLRDRTAGSAC